MTTDFELVITADGDNPNVWDLKLTNGDFTLVTGTNGIAQSIRERLGLFQQEWFLDRTQGTPWFQRILEDGTNQAYIQSVLQRVIESAAGVSKALVTSYVYEGSTRNLRVSYEATTVEGQIITASDFNPLVIED